MPLPATSPVWHYRRAMRSPLPVGCRPHTTSLNRVGHVWLTYYFQLTADGLIGAGFCRLQPLHCPHCSQ